jgi:hypothetical protein
MNMEITENFLIQFFPVPRLFEIPVPVTALVHTCLSVSENGPVEAGENGIDQLSERLIVQILLLRTKN